MRPTDLDVDTAEDFLSGPNHVATVDLAEHRHYTRQMVVYIDPDTLNQRGFIYLNPKTEESLDDRDRWEQIPVATFPVVAETATVTVYRAMAD